MAMDIATLNDLFPDPGVLRELDATGKVSDDCRNAVMRKLRVKSDNRSCFECSTRNPTWCSVSFGVYLCLECSGEHRRKGVHITYVRSVDMDKFYPQQLVRMACGGNGAALSFFKESGMGKASGRRVDYSSKQAIKYKAQLDKLMETTCATLEIDASADVDDAADKPEIAGSLRAPTPELSARSCPWKLDQRVQFRDKGNPTWKWGFVTHTKPLKIDFAQHDEVRETPSAPVLDAAAQKAMCFAPAGAVSKVASAAAPSSSMAQRGGADGGALSKAGGGTGTAPTAAGKSNNTIIRRTTTAPSAAPGGAAPGGYPSATASQSVAPVPTKQLVKEVDFDQFSEEPEVSKPSPDAKAAAPIVRGTKEKPEGEAATLSSTEVAGAGADAAPDAVSEAEAPPAKPKKAVETMDFDFDFE